MREPNPLGTVVERLRARVRELMEENERLRGDRDWLHSLKCDIGLALGGDDPRPFTERIRALKAEVADALEGIGELQQEVAEYEKRFRTSTRRRVEAERDALREALEAVQVWIETDQPILTDVGLDAAMKVRALAARPKGQGATP